MRYVSEFIALLTIVVLAVVSAVLLNNFVGGLISSSRANVKYLDASVSGIEVLHVGSPMQVQVSGSTFTASYIYRLNAVVHNAGNQKVTGLSFSTLSVDTSIKVCTSDTCDIYDPVVFLTTYSSLPTDLNPNQAVQISFTILSKRDLLSLGYSPFVIRVRGNLPDGSSVTTYISLIKG